MHSWQQNLIIVISVVFQEYPFLSQGRLLGLNFQTPTEIPAHTSNFPLKILAIKIPPPPLEFPMTLHGHFLALHTLN